MKFIIYCRKSSESDEKQIQSIEDQLGVLTPLASQRGLEILSIITESASAKKPGRVKFNEMLDQIESGNASGILTWDCSRLSRNSIDIGRIVYMMDLGKLVEVITPTQSFKNTPNDKFMINIFCSQAKLENDTKSENVKRSLHAKAARGQYPSFAPPGYTNNPQKRQGTRDITPHPVYYPLMKKLLIEALTGKYSVAGLCRLSKDMGIRNFKNKPLTKTTMYRHLTNIFYTGQFIYKRKIYKGEHLPMISIGEFEQLQNIIQGRSKSEQYKHDFAFGGKLINCGECGFGIVGETHIKRYKHGGVQHFTYYRCSKKGSTKCKQSYIREHDLEQQFLEFLSSIEIHKDFLDWALEALKDLNSNQLEVRRKQYTELRRQHDEIQKRLENLIDMRLSPKNKDGDLVTDDEFTRIKHELNIKRDEVKKSMDSLDVTNDQWIDQVSKVFDFMSDLKNKFINGSSSDKRLIIQSVSSNLSLKDKKLNIQTQKPYQLISDLYNEVGGAKDKFEPINGLVQQSNPFKDIVEYPMWNEVRTTI